MIGYLPTGRRWPTDLEISGTDAPAETFKLDPSLPVLGQDPKNPQDLVVIPKGRLVGVGSKDITSGSGAGTNGAITESHDTVLTLADGVNIAPLGFAGYAMHSAWYQDRSVKSLPSLFKNKLIGLPYIASSTGFTNGIFGDLTQGDKVTAYPGYHNSTTVDNRHIGKVVKYIERKFYNQWLTLGATITSGALSDAAYAHITPRAILGFTAAGVPTTGTAAWKNSVGWVVTFTASAVKNVIYSWGQGPEMIAGTVLGLELIDSDYPGWLKWVRDNYGAWDLPRIQLPGFTTATTAQAANLASIGDNEFTIDVGGVQRQIAAYKSITVYVSAGCSYFDGDTGDWTTTTDAWTALPRFTNLYIEDYSIGKNYTINPIGNTLRLMGVKASDGSTTVPDTDIRVDYYYEDLGSGQRYDSGQMQLTDGYYSSLGGGTPAHIDVAGSVGILRVMID